ncbi:hypothetical protein D3C72_2018680 [compost metagenome]
MSEPSIASGTTSVAPAACSLSRCRSSCVRTTTGTCGAWDRVLASTFSAAGTSMYVMATALARTKPAAISACSRVASPYTTESPAAAAWRTRSGSRSSAM